MTSKVYPSPADESERTRIDCYVDEIMRLDCALFRKHKWIDTAIYRWYAFWLVRKDDIAVLLEIIYINDAHK